MCATSDLDAFMADKFVVDKSYWDFLQVTPNSQYFGSVTGSIRVFPAYSTPSCYLFDPRIRPWFIVASSLPKNVILVLDPRSPLAKAGVDRILTTLTPHVDSVAIVSVAGNVTTSWEVAESETLESLASMVELAATEGAVDDAAIVQAFETTVDLLQETANTTKCQTAVLYFGEHTEIALESLTQIETAVNSLNETSTLSFWGYHTAEDPTPGTIPLVSQLACTFPVGQWVSMNSKSYVTIALTHYYEAMALPLAYKDDYIAWAEPYPYFFSAEYGTTVSVPVFDRDGASPRFIGVVGIDLSLSELDASEKVIPDGTLSAREGIVRQIAQEAEQLRSCPDVELFAQHDQSTCAMEAIPELVKCPTGTVYPDKMWINEDYEGVPFRERACCTEDSATDSCQPAWLSTPAEETSRASHRGTFLLAVASAAALVIGH